MGREKEREELMLQRKEGEAGRERETGEEKGREWRGRGRGGRPITTVGGRRDGKRGWLVALRAGLALDEQEGFLSTFFFSYLLPFPPLHTSSFALPLPSSHLSFPLLLSALSLSPISFLPWSLPFLPPFRFSFPLLPPLLPLPFPVSPFPYARGTCCSPPVSPRPLTLPVVVTRTTPEIP